MLDERPLIPVYGLVLLATYIRLRFFASEHMRLKHQYGELKAKNATILPTTPSSAESNPSGDL